MFLIWFNSFIEILRKKFLISFDGYGGEWGSCKLKKVLAGWEVVFDLNPMPVKAEPKMPPPVPRAPAADGVLRVDIEGWAVAATVLLNPSLPKPFDGVELNIACCCCEYKWLNVACCSEARWLIVASCNEARWLIAAFCSEAR